jgi:hypothetical protein
MKREADLLKKQVRDLTTKNIMLKNLNEQLVKQNKLFANDVEILETELDCVRTGKDL